MKKYILTIALLSALILVSCNISESKNDGDIVDNERLTKYKMYGKNLWVVTIDSCEYIYCFDTNATWCTYKGNCKFCETRKLK